jgi:hypothetical protein
MLMIKRVLLKPRSSSLSIFDYEIWNYFVTHIPHPDCHKFIRTLEVSFCNTNELQKIIVTNYSSLSNLFWRLDRWDKSPFFVNVIPISDANSTQNRATPPQQINQWDYPILPQLILVDKLPLVAVVG